jgi:hypothetical protein
MEKPNLDRMWETWIKIGPVNSLTSNMFQESIRNKIYPMVSDLENRIIINWYHFLFHSYPQDPNNGYFHAGRPLSGWGLIGAALCMVAGLSVMLGLIIPVSTIHIVLNLPIAVQEMVFAVWLIVKGFNPSVIASEPHVGS